MKQHQAIKLAVCLTTTAFSSACKKEAVDANAQNPGLVSTEQNLKVPSAEEKKDLASAQLMQVGAGIAFCKGDSAEALKLAVSALIITDKEKSPKIWSDCKLIVGDCFSEMAVTSNLNNKTESFKECKKTAEEAYQEIIDFKGSTNKEKAIEAMKRLNELK